MSVNEIRGKNVNIVGRSPPRLSDEQVNLLKELMRRFISDIRKGLSPSDAGWVVDKGEHKKLPCELIERERGMVRVNPSSNIPHVLREADEETRWLADLCLDMLKADRVRILIHELAKKFERDSRLMWAVVVVGLSWMFRELSTHVTTELVFNAGLSAIDWHREIPSASVELALNLVREWCNIGLEELNRLEEALSNDLLGRVLRARSKPEVIRRIKHALKWNEVAHVLGDEKDTIAFLGLLWFVDLLSISKGVKYPESISIVSEEAWKMFTLSTIRLQSEREISERIEEILNKLKGIVEGVCWEGVIRLPWG